MSILDSSVVHFTNLVKIADLVKIDSVVARSIIALDARCDTVMHRATNVK